MDKDNNRAGKSTWERGAHIRTSATQPPYYGNHPLINRVIARPSAPQGKIWAILKGTAAS